MKITLATALPLALATALAYHTGWMDGERPWQDATGWSRIPPDLRPGSDIAWPADAGTPPVIRWLGHSGFFIRWHGHRLLLDPNLSPRITIAWRRFEPPVRADELGAIDAALVSHAHLDHLDLPTLTAIPALGMVVVPRGTEGDVAELRPRVHVTGIRVGEHLRLGDLDIVAVPAMHNGGRWHPFPSAQRRAVGYVVRHGAAAIYFAGDTGPANDFATIAAYHPTVAILPIGAYSPPFPIGRYHLTPEQAAIVARELGAPIVIPCHFGTFALALDRPSAALPWFAVAAREHGVRWSMPRLIERADLRASSALASVTS